LIQGIQAAEKPEDVPECLFLLCLSALKQRKFKEAGDILQQLRLTLPQKSTRLDG
jgi:cytochrome c-type biogenesis protein CcmH/NrfG